MTIALERLVRPYQKPTALAFGRVISRTVAPSADTATILWGDVGTLPTPTQEDVPDDSVGFTVEVCDTDYTETSRIVQPVKVKNPDDDSQFVIVDRIQSMSFRSQEKAKLAGAIRSETTTFGDTGFGGSLESVPLTQNCKSSFNLAGT
jgi:hypothetical protein